MKFRGIEASSAKIKRISIEGNLLVLGEYYYIVTNNDEQYLVLPETVEVFLYGKWEKISDINKPKRKPDSNGVLELTKEELVEFVQFFDSKRVRKIRQVRLRGIKLEFDATARQYPYDMAERELTNYKAILYLAERFNLTGGE